MGTKRTVHVVGTGTIGEPLIGLLLHLQQDLSVDEITFHKHSPRIEDRPKIKSLMRRGAKLAVDADRMTDFEKIGLQPTYIREAALEQASVVVECTTDGLALQHKENWYTHLPKTKGFIAQGSEFGFGKMYAYGINDDTLVPGEDRFLQVVSCNTHNLAVLINTLALHGEAADNLIEGRFVCMRRASDISQEKSFIPAPDVGKHKDSQFGTHHAPMLGICSRRWVTTSIYSPPPLNSIRSICIASGLTCACSGP
jgi:glyceraldehyde-3-phosphate dehydrogenase/erythrose-4-phosphate dehydrogenase